MQKLSLQHRQVQVFEGLTQSVFPRTEKKLNRLEYQRALQYIACRKNVDRYWDVLDFLFCEIFTEFRPHCFKFYKDNGPRLIYMVPAARIKAYDLVLSEIFLEFLLMCHEHKARLSWHDFREWPLREIGLSISKERR